MDIFAITSMRTGSVTTTSTVKTGVAPIDIQLLAGTLDRINPVIGVAAVHLTMRTLSAVRRVQNQE